MGDKKLVNTSTQKSTKSDTKPDGTVIETITTVTTEKFSDGSTQTRTGVETITKPPGSSGGGGGGSGVSSSIDRTGFRGNSSSDLSTFAKPGLGAFTNPKNPVMGTSSSPSPKVVDAPSPSHAMINATATKLGASTSGVTSVPKAGLDAQSYAMMKATNAKLTTPSPALNESSKSGIDSSTSKVGQNSPGPTPTVASSTWSESDSSSYPTSRLGVRPTEINRFIKSSQGVGGARQPASVSPKDSKAPKVQNTTNPQFIQECLNQHNALRAKHHSPPLVINADLMKISQAWANNLANLGKMQHSTCGFGENVYWSTDMVDGKRPTDQWYSEIKDFSWKKMEGQSGTGHFTQVIWKGSQEFGIAMAKGKNGIYVVANYNPPGNFVGRYKDNVLPI